jgi:hypothetical protein
MQHCLIIDNCHHDVNQHCVQLLQWLIRLRDRNLIKLRYYIANTFHGRLRAEIESEFSQPAAARHDTLPLALIVN